MKIGVRPGDTPDIVAARYGLTVDRLEALNSGDAAASAELTRARAAVGADQEIRGVATLEIGIEIKTVVAKLSLGSRLSAPTLDPAFEYYAVNEIIPPVLPGSNPLPYTHQQLAIDCLRTNPASVKKKLPIKEYTLALNADGTGLYWQLAKPAKFNPQALTRGALIPPGTVPALGADRIWHHVESKDPWAKLDAKSHLERNPHSPDKVVKTFESVSHTLLLVNDDVYWESLPTADEGNPEFQWLTYETRANSPDYQKGKAALAYGLFAVPLDYRAEVVAARDLPDILASAFFPGMSVAEVQAVSSQSCRWRGGSGEPPTHGPNSVEQQMAARTEVVIHAPRMIVMPYNYYANDTGSYAIGTDLSGEIVPGPAFRLTKCWPMWETASRSSVSKIEATSEDDLTPPKRLNEQWQFRSAKQPAGAEIVAAYKGKPFKLGEHANCYSVKTGVRWLGKKAQGSGDPGGGKDVLESNALLASMRSDWVEHVEDTVGRSPVLIVLRELLTVTFQNYFRKGRDGYQIRDLRPLDSAKVYFPPLSIPFGGAAFVDAYNKLHRDAPLDFETFWLEHYARAVGRAKAELLLRYGLQLTTPNPQNFLLEFERGTLAPTGRVVIRDIGDAKIHSEVIGQIGRGHPAIEYELTNPKRPGYLPAQTNNQDRRETPDHAIAHERFDNYPLDTRTHWHQYSTFKDQYGGNLLPRKVLTTVDWGRAHYAAYVEHLATRLGHPALQLPVFGQDAYDRAVAAVEVRHAMEGETAKAILPAVLARAGGVHAAINVATYQQVLADPSLRHLSERNVLLAEWALELHTDEVLHGLLSSPEVLAKVKAKWTK